MSRLYLIRHGQASFGAANYDVLSDMGAKQANALGQYLADGDVELDAVYSGPRDRQKDTAHHLLEAANDAGRRYPCSQVMDDFDEFPAFEIYREWIPKLRSTDPTIASAFENGDSRGIERAYLQLTEMWCTGELDSGELETYENFHERVTRGLRHVMESHGRKSRVAIVTSAGPIAIAMRLALSLAAESLTMAWVIRNASFSEFRYRDPEELSLFGFNHAPHLDETLLTYR